MEDLYNLISCYDASLEDPAITKRLLEYQSKVDYGHRTAAKVNDLTRLAALSFSFGYNDDFIQRVVGQIEQVMGDEKVLEKIVVEERLEVLNDCLKLYVEFGDLDTARKIASRIGTVPSQYTSPGHPPIPKEVLIQKITALTTIGAAEARSLAHTQTEKPTPEEVLAILQSGQREAIVALAYLGIICEEDSASLDLPNPDEVLEALQEGIDQRLMSTRQIISERALKQIAESEPLSPLAREIKPGGFSLNNFSRECGFSVSFIDDS